MDYNEARKYIDVESVYGEVASGTLSAEEAWKQSVSFMADVADKKFTRYFRYNEYEIIEDVRSNDAYVSFKDYRNGGLSITYGLKKVKEQWIVSRIKYRRKDR